MTYGVLSLQSQPVHLLKDGDSVVSKALRDNFLLRWWLMSTGHESFSGVTKPTFATKDKLRSTTVKFGAKKNIFNLSRSNYCVLKK